MVVHTTRPRLYHDGLPDDPEQRRHHPDRTGAERHLDPLHGDAHGHRAHHPEPAPASVRPGPAVDQNKGYSELPSNYGGFNLRHAMQSNGRSGGSTSAVHTVSVRSRWVGKSGRIRRGQAPPAWARAWG